jgi:hypothetical protein
MITELSREQRDNLSRLLLSHYAASTPKIIGAVENKAGAATFAISLKEGQYITFAEIVKPTIPVTVDKFAIEWVQEKMGGSLGEAVKTALKKRGKLNYQAFELDTRIDNDTKIRRIPPFGHIEFVAVLPHTQFTFDYYAEELKNLGDLVTTASEAKPVFQRIQSLSESLKNALIEAPKKSELFDKLNECYQILDKRQASQKQAHEEACKANYEELKPRLIAVQEGLKTATIFKEWRDTLRAIQNDLQEKTLARETRQELYDIVHACYEEMDKRREQAQEEYEKITNANFEQVQQQVLAQKEAIAQSMDVQASREELKKIQVASWETVLTREQRKTIHDLFNEYFELISRRYEELRFQFEQESNSNKDQLALKVEEVERFVNNSTDLKATREQLKAMQKELNDVKLMPSHRQELWNLIDKAFKELNKKMEEAQAGELKISEEQYAGFKPLLDAAIEESKTTENFKEARQKLIDLQNQFKDLQLMHKHRRELWKLMDNAFKDLNARADVYFTQKRKEREEKQKQWENRMLLRSGKMTSTIRKMKQENQDAVIYLKQLQGWLSTVRDNAATKEFRQTILDKIKNTEDQITSRNERMKEMEKALNEVKSKNHDKPQSAPNPVKAEEKKQEEISGSADATAVSETPEA